MNIIKDMIDKQFSFLIYSKNLKKKIYDICHLP